MKFLFDLGGVFFDWDPHFFYKDVFSNTEERENFLNNICNDEWNIQQDAGRLIKDAEDDIIKKFPKYEDKIKLYYKNHQKMFRKVFQNSVDVLHDLKNKKYECYVLSNWSWETFQGMEVKYPFLNQFDDLIISGKEKLIKPDAKIYKLAMNRFKLIPEETVFIDDKKENIEAASKLGFLTIHLTNPEIITQEINIFI